MSYWEGPNSSAAGQYGQNWISPTTWGTTAGFNPATGRYDSPGTLDEGSPFRNVEWGTYDPMSREYLDALGGGAPPDLATRYPGSTYVNTATDPRFAYGRREDFAGRLGNWMLPLLATAVGGGMIAPWAAAGGAGMGAGGAMSELGAGTWGSEFNPAWGADLTGGGAGAGVGVEGWAPVVSRTETPNSILNMLASGSSPAALLQALSMGGPGALFGGGFGAPGSMPWGSAGNLFNIGSGLYGMYQGDQLRKNSQRWASQADPFGPYRAGFGAQLQSLVQNPSSLTSTPGYQAGLDAVTRNMAAQGYLGSGNMMAALAKYGENAYNQQAQLLASLAGANFNPANAGQLAQGGDIAGAQLTGNALNRLGMAAYLAGRQYG